MPCEYAIRVRGRLAPAFLSALEPLRVVDAGAETELCAALPDQAALYGLIARLQSFGVELVSVERLPRTGRPGARR